MRHEKPTCRRGQVRRLARRRPYWGRGRRNTKMRTGDCWPLPSMKLPNVPACDAKTSQPSATSSLTAFSAADQSRDRPQKPARLGEPDTILYSKRVIVAPFSSAGPDATPDRGGISADRDVEPSKPPRSGEFDRSARTEALLLGKRPPLAALLRLAAVGMDRPTLAVAANLD